MVGRDDHGVPVLFYRFFPPGEGRAGYGAGRLMPPGSAVLARSVEYFRIPRGIITVTFGKSTYARCGVLVNVTPFEPEWEGYVTISIINANAHPALLYAGEGIAQVLFLGGDGDCERSYADKKGKYQAQRGITTARVDGPGVDSR